MLKFLLHFHYYHQIDLLNQLANHLAYMMLNIQDHFLKFLFQIFLILVSSITTYAYFVPTSFTVYWIKFYVSHTHGLQKLEFLQQLLDPTNLYI